jgi:hypothetical protein
MVPSPVLDVRALPDDHLSYGGEGAWMSKAWNGDLSQKLCSFCLSQKLCCFCIQLAHPPQSIDLHRLFSDGLVRQDGSFTCSGDQNPPRWPPLLWWGRYLEVFSPKQGLSQKLCLFCLSQKLYCFCCPLAHPLQSACWSAQTVLRGIWQTSWLPHLLWGGGGGSEPSWAATSPLAEKVLGCLEQETGYVPEAVLLLQSTCSASAVCELIWAVWSQGTLETRWLPHLLWGSKPSLAATFFRRRRCPDVWSLKQGYVPDTV